jgi:DNA-binding response OmpR family regulator
MMPVMDGYKVLQVVKTDPKLSKIPVLVFSAKGQPEEVEKALNLGASGYIVKATTKINEMIDKIRATISRQPVEQEVTHYTVGIRTDSYDAKKLAEDLKLGDLTCPACNSWMVLDLIPDFSHDKPWFSAKLFCPRCRA